MSCRQAKGDSSQKMLNIDNLRQRGWIKRTHQHLSILLFWPGCTAPSEDPRKNEKRPSHQNQLTDNFTNVGTPHLHSEVLHTGDGSTDGRSREVIFTFLAGPGHLLAWTLLSSFSLDYMHWKLHLGFTFRV